MNHQSTRGVINTDVFVGERGVKIALLPLLVFLLLLIAIVAIVLAGALALQLAAAAAKQGAEAGVAPFRGKDKDSGPIQL